MKQMIIFGQQFMGVVGFSSSVVYGIQSLHQIRAHGFRHWLELGFEKLEEIVESDEVEGEVA